MKLNEAPEKLYVHVKKGKVLNIWNSEWVGVNDIEYARKDVFIENAFKFFSEHLWEYIDVKNANCDTFIYIDGDKLKEDFKNYMK